MNSKSLASHEKDPELANHSIDPDNLNLILSTPTTDHPKDEEAAQKQVIPWKPAKQEYLMMVTLAFISLMVALDAGILVPVLLVLPDPTSAAVNHSLMNAVDSC